jgi:predicted DNA-binding transcriptional regulator YafY
MRVFLFFCGQMILLIAAAERCDADALAEELECSRRTIHRDLQVLELRGSLWFYVEALAMERLFEENA